MSLRVADITDLGIAKQVATLALAELDRVYVRLELLTKQNAELRGTKAPEQLELELLRIREQMMALQRRTFAASSEKRAREHDEAPRSPEPPLGPREQRKLPVEEHVHELATDERACTACGREMVAWTGQHEEVEEVDVVRREFVLKKHRRIKYRCRCGASPKLAAGPLRLPGGGRYALDFAIESAVAKYLDHSVPRRQ